MSNITFLTDRLNRLDCWHGRAPALRALSDPKSSAEVKAAASGLLDDTSDLLWSAPGDPVSIPIRSARADEALAAIRGHLATHAARRAEYVDYARSNTPVAALTRAEADTILPPVRQFRCNEIGGPAWLRTRRLDMLSGVVLLLAVGWLGGVISAVMVL